MKLAVSALVVSLASVVVSGVTVSRLSGLESRLDALSSPDAGKEPSKAAEGKGAWASEADLKKLRAEVEALRSQSGGGGTTPVAGTTSGPYDLGELEKALDAIEQKRRGESRQAMVDRWTEQSLARLKPRVDDLAKASQLSGDSVTRLNTVVETMCRQDAEAMADLRSTPKDLGARRSEIYAAAMEQIKKLLTPEQAAEFSKHEHEFRLDAPQKPRGK